MPFQLLSLSGGGYLGLYTATVLAELEHHIQRPIASCFDLIAGTSVGGIIALGLAKEIPAADIAAAFEELGTQVFSDRPAPQSAWAKCGDLLRSWWTPKYEATDLRQSVLDLLGQQITLGDLLHPLLVPAFNVSTGRPQIFKTPHHLDFRRDFTKSVVDVAIATSAAPTYFPLAEVGEHLFVDGGIYANSPDLIAVHEAEHFFNMPTEELRLLSVGTTTTRFSFPHREGKNLGIQQWSGRLAKVMIAAQQASVDDIVRHRLGQNYLRIDYEQAPETMAHLSLDTAGDSATQALRSMAEASVQNNINLDLLQDMLAHVASPARFYYGPRAEGGS
ncbi:MAG: CBASS cGAMP-activated phospholipase [Methyloligella sp. ZOD6]